MVCWTLDLPQCKEIFKRAMKIPLDLQDSRSRFPSLVKKFGGSLGLVILVYLLKLPPARDAIEANIHGVGTVNAKSVYEACVKTARNALDHNIYEPLVDVTAETGGSLKAHGFLAQFQHMGITEKVKTVPRK